MSFPVESEEITPSIKDFTSDENSGGENLTGEMERQLLRSVKEREATYLQGFRQRAVVELALFTGAKVNELARLRCQDVCLEPGLETLRIPSRSHPRVLPLMQEMSSYLREYLAAKTRAGESTAPTAPLVCSQRGSALTSRGWQDAWGLCQHHAGLIDGNGRPLFSLECARQVTGRRIYRLASNPHHVQAWLGLDMTTNADRYSPENLRVTPESLRSTLGAVADNHAATLRKAMAYYNGTAGVMDRHRARQLFLDLPADDPLAQMWIARSLSRGRCLFPYNPTLGEEVAQRVIGTIREMAEADHPMALYMYASARDEGLACKRDSADSVRLYTRTAELGFETGINNLALKYHWGHGVEKDDARALELFHEAATLHEVSAMFNLGVMYSEGMGTKKDMEKASRWMHRAASLGEIRSMRNLSYMYHTGTGVPKDTAIAERWFCLAGEIPSASDGVVKPSSRIEMIKMVG